MVSGSADGLIKKQLVTGIAILDDDADMGSLNSYLVQTDIEVGLVANDLVRVGNLFKAPMPEKL